MIAQYPAAYLMQKLPIAKVLGFATLGWGIVLMTVCIRCPALDGPVVDINLALDARLSQLCWHRCQPLHIRTSRSNSQPWLRNDDVDMVSNTGAAFAP